MYEMGFYYGFLCGIIITVTIHFIVTVMMADVTDEE